MKRSVWEKGAPLPTLPMALSQDTCCEPCCSNHSITGWLRGQGPLWTLQPKPLLKAGSHAAGCPGPWKHRKSGYKNKRRKSGSPDTLLGQGWLQQSCPHHPLPYCDQRKGCLPLNYRSESKGCALCWACCLSAVSHRICNSEQQPESQTSVNSSWALGLKEDAWSASEH